MAPCPTGQRQSAVTAAGGLGVAKPSAATLTPGEKTKAPLLFTGWWSVIPSAQHYPKDQDASRLPGCRLSATALRSLAASPWFPWPESPPDPPWAPRGGDGHGSPSTRSKGFNPVPVRVQRDKSMQ